MTDPRASTRKTIIQNLEISSLKSDDALFPKELVRDNPDLREVWQLIITTRTGLMPSKVSLSYFISEQEAYGIMKKYPIGSELPTLEQEDGMHSFIRQVLGSGFPWRVTAGDEDSFLAYEVLENAGIHKDGRISEDALSFLGEERIKELKGLFGENWQIAAEFEYCWITLPHTSAAFIAASYRYHHYISGDEFSAGYHWRDLEVIVHAVEAEATKAIETRKRAGKGGSTASIQARENRRAAFMLALETVAQRNPDLIKLGEKIVASLALKIAIEDNPTLWKQGKGQMTEYLGESRGGEAGPDMKKRYRTLFGDEPPKRFGRLR